MSRDISDIFSSLQTPFDLERRHTQVDQARDQVISGQVLRAEQVLNVFEINKLSVADDLIWYAAGLRTFATIRRPAAKRLARQALTRISDAKRAVHEHLDREIDRLADSMDFGKCQLACQ